MCVPSDCPDGHGEHSETLIQAWVEKGGVFLWAYSRCEITEF